MDTLSENKVSVTVTAISGEDSTKSSSLTFTVEKTYYMVADINSGSGSSNPDYLTVYDGKLYFQAYDGTNGSELWVYDGSTASMVADINSSGSSSPDNLTVYDGRLYFQANDGTNGTELWVYND
jgi:ELWxxDGT repeat protein